MVKLTDVSESQLWLHLIQTPASMPREESQHASFDCLPLKCKSYELVFAFDQSFSRQVKTKDVIREKLIELREKGCHDGCTTIHTLGS